METIPPPCPLGIRENHSRDPQLLPARLTGTVWQAGGSGAVEQIPVASALLSNPSPTRPGHQPNTGDPAVGGGSRCLKGIKEGHTVWKEVLVRLPDSCPRPLALVRRPAVLRGPRREQGAAGSREEAAELGLQVVPHLAHLEGEKEHGGVRKATSWLRAPADGSL